MSLRDFGKKILSKAWKEYADNLPKFTMHSTIAGWVLAIASNVFGVSIDKKIDKKEKKYLIPREIGDGVSNILLFVGMTELTTWGINKLLDKKKIIPKEGLDEKILKNGLGVGASLLGAIIVSNVLAPIIRNAFAARSQKKFLEKQNNTQVPSVANPTNPIQNNSPKINMQTFWSAIHTGTLRV